MRLTRYILVVQTVVLVAAIPAKSACLLDDYSVEAEIARSEVVAMVSVSSGRQGAEDSTSDELGGTLYTLVIQESFVGRALGQVNVISENSSGRFPMQKGTTYIVFLYVQEEGVGSWTLDSAQSSRFWTAWSRVMVMWPYELIERAELLGY